MRKLLILTSLLLAACQSGPPKLSDKNHPCNGTRSCLEKWDVCWNYCEEKKGKGINRFCSEYKTPLKNCPRCWPYERMTEKHAAMYDAKVNCGDYNYERELKRSNSYWSDCKNNDWPNPLRPITLLIKEKRELEAKVERSTGEEKEKLLLEIEDLNNKINSMWNEVYSK